MRFGKIFRVIIIAIVLWGCKKSGSEEVLNTESFIENKIYDQLAETPFRFLGNESWITVNSGYKEVLKEICVDSIKYNIALNENKIDVIETHDEKFFTSEGYSIKTKIKNILGKTGQSLLVEPGVYAFVPLKDGWRAVISYDISNFSPDKMNLNGTVKSFLKITPKLSNCMTLEEWLLFLKGTHTTFE